MTTLKTVTIAAVLLAGGTSLAEGPAKKSAVARGRTPSRTGIGDRCGAVRSSCGTYSCQVGASFAVSTRHRIPFGSRRGPLAGNNDV